MERLLHYVWKYKLYTSELLLTTEGKEISIIDAGIQNTNAGPDFFNAKVKTDNTVWAGSVEIHDKASDWLKHKHDKDKSYDTVILHVTGENDTEIYRTNGEMIPQLVISVPDNIRNNIDWLLHSEQQLPCINVIREADPFVLSSWMSSLVSERLERKTKDILNLLERYNDDWNEVFYIMLTRNFGFGLNSDAFEQLAHSLPMSYIRKQRHSISQVESLLFGQAGMLEENNNNEHYCLLQREYKFLSHKFGLKKIDTSRFKNLRTRPVNFPHVKLAQLSALWFKYDTLFSHLLHAGTLNEIRQYLRISASDYWDTHYNFKSPSASKPKIIGEDAINILIINTVVPMMFSYGQQHNLPEYCERATVILERLQPEQNSITRQFAGAGMKIATASDSQSVIQLKREYCEKRKCMYCRIGFLFLKRQ